jgi:organic hydroperoxide reductase OsmC/OhrA
MTEPMQYEIILDYPATPGQPLTPQEGFSRDSRLHADGKPDVAASAPGAFGGDASRYNPEELMLMSLAQCHMLTYLAIAAKKRIAVLAYTDRAVGELGIGANGKMAMRSVVLYPRVTIARGGNADEAMAVHAKAHANCFMANSVNFTVSHQAEIVEAGA